jgi:hypothetical protein
MRMTELMEDVAVVVPIRGGRAEAARQLVKEGPSFDL